ncbi:sigma-E factor regulatory protein RseB domain-containing protein [Shigella flexneri]
MNLASQSLNYELSSSASINRVLSLCVIDMHASITALLQYRCKWMARAGKWTARQRNSHFEPGLERFTLNGDYIVDSLPSLSIPISNAFPYYDFISVGRRRTADCLCEVIRAVARDVDLQLHRADGHRIEITDAG